MPILNVDQSRSVIVLKAVDVIGVRRHRTVVLRRRNVDAVRRRQKSVGEVIEELKAL